MADAAVDEVHDRDRPLPGSHLEGEQIGVVSEGLRQACEQPPGGR